MFGKKYNGGSLLWFNTGDTFDDPPKAITTPDKNFIGILSECFKIDLYALDDSKRNCDAIFEQLHKCDFNRPFVFISYCDKNAYRVYEICLMLDLLGVNYFLDKKNIVSTAFGNDGWKEEVKKALNNQNCNAAFIFLSEEFFDSPNCVFEIERISLQKKFVPVILSISLSTNKIPRLMNGWNAVSDLKKTKLFSNLLSLKKKTDSPDLEICQLVFNCHRNLSQFHNPQLLNTIVANCNVDEKLINDKEYIQSLISKCKAITSD